MKKLNQKYINKIIFSKLFENEKPIPELGSLGPLDFGSFIGNQSLDDYSFDLPSDLDPGILRAIEQKEKEKQEIENKYYFFLDYYKKFKEWYKREYPEDNDPGRLQRAWEALQKEIQRLIDRGYTRHEIDKYHYEHTDGKHNRNYEDFPDWYHTSNEEYYKTNDKNKWDIPKRNGQIYRYS